MTTTLPFTSWELRPELLAGLEAQGLQTPTPVQSEAFPAVLSGRDLLVQSRTGTGKTYAFALPILQRLPVTERPRVDALIVLPTRELALQVATSITKLARPMGVEVAAVYGGGSYRDQLRAIAHGARIVVGTPGRLVDHLERERLDLSSCRTLVLDEADEMLDLGFAEELERIFSALPADRQSLLFSATLAPEIRALATKTLREPQEIRLSQGGKSAPEIQHVAYECFAEAKTDALVNVLHVDQPALAIVFCHTKLETEQIAERLREEGFSAGFLNGDLPQEARSRTLNQFRRGLIDLLVATDVAARGIDVKGVSHVYNLGVPRDPESYIHRVGRTGRAGASGEAVTFVPPRDAARFRRMLINAGVEIKTKPVPQPSDVRTKLRERFHEQLTARIATGPDPDYLALASELLGYIEPADLVAALLAGNEDARATLSAGNDIVVPRRPSPVAAASGPARAKPSPRGAKGDRPGEAAPARGARGGETPKGQAGTDRPSKGEVRAFVPDGEEGPKRPLRRLSEHHEPGFTRLWLNQGKSHGLTRGALVKLVCGVGNVQGAAIGAIAIHPHFAFFDVRDADARRVSTQLNGMNYRGRALKANVVE
ncbi:MAG: DEAD/DEAH box helicase [Candidatus Sericytochromatia bacterium]|nr:DEAD/DEAH box helicase [Candidatus Sericytochromatia bacterium]